MTAIQNKSGEKEGLFGEDFIAMLCRKSRWVEMKRQIDGL